MPLDKLCRYHRNPACISTLLLLQSLSRGISTSIYIMLYNAAIGIMEAETRMTNGPEAKHEITDSWAMNAVFQGASLYHEAQKRGLDAEKITQGHRLGVLLGDDINAYTAFDLSRHNPKFASFSVRLAAVAATRISQRMDWQLRGNEYTPETRSRLQGFYEQHVLDSHDLGSVAWADRSFQAFRQVISETVSEVERTPVYQEQLAYYNAHFAELLESSASAAVPVKVYEAPRSLPLETVDSSRTAEQQPGGNSRHNVSLHEK